LKDGVTTDPPIDGQTVPPQQSMEEVKHKETVSDPNDSRESWRNGKAEVILHSTPASGSSVSPMLPSSSSSSQEANSTFTKPTNSTFTKADESCTDMDSHTPRDNTQLQIPSTKNAVNKVRGNISVHCQTVVFIAFKVW